MSQSTQNGSRVNYYIASQMLKSHKKTIDEEEKRLKSELDDKLAILKLRRKFITKRRTLLKNDVENLKLQAEVDRQRAEEKKTETELDDWRCDHGLDCAEATFQLPEANVQQLLGRITELLPLSMPCFEDCDNHKKPMRSLDEEADRLLKFD